MRDGLGRFPLHLLAPQMESERKQGSYGEVVADGVEQLVVRHLSVGCAQINQVSGQGKHEAYCDREAFQAILKRFRYGVNRFFDKVTCHVFR